MYAHFPRNMIVACDDCIGRREQIRDAVFGFQGVLTRLAQIESKILISEPNEISSQVKSNSAMIKRMSEMQEIKDRKLNLILYGLEEAQVENHSEIANEVFTLLNPDVVQHNAVRLGKSKLIKITFSNAADRLSVLNNSKRLKHHPVYNKVYVNPDLTPDQLASSKKLREDLKQCRISHPTKTFMIKNGTVVEINGHENNAQYNMDTPRTSTNITERVGKKKRTTQPE